MPEWCSRAPDGAWILRVHAQPGAKRTEVAGTHGESLKIRVRAPALEDRANEALVDFIAEALGVARRDVVLASGARSREKRFEVRDPAADPSRLLSP
ncbi:MAG TPA: DUF167 domain-containing protein [Usitatibacter sp.]|nr:DUF167 domain-containing protein [Usitatibacter sp.]